MTPLSRWKLNQKEEERVISLLISQLAKVDNDAEMAEFLNIILSETELLMIAKRMIAIMLVEMGKTDVEIGKLLHVTRATANRFRNAYKYGKNKPEVSKLVGELKRNKEMEAFLRRITEYLLTAPFGRIPKRSLF